MADVRGGCRGPGAGGWPSALHCTPTHRPWVPTTCWAFTGPGCSAYRPTLWSRCSFCLIPRVWQQDVALCPQSVAESGVARRLGPGDLSPRLSFSWRDPLLVGGGRTAPPTPRSPPGVGANLEIPGAHSSLPWRPSRIRTGEDVNARPGHMGFVLQGGPQRDRREHRVPAFVVPFLPTAVISLDGTRRRPVGLRASFCISPRCGPLAPWPHLWWVGGGGNSPSGKIRYQRWAVP